MTKSLYMAATVEHSTAWESGGVIVAAAMTGVLGAIVTPVVAVAVEEGRFASQQSQTQSSS
jgi:hypothetical protein